MLWIGWNVINWYRKVLYKSRGLCAIFWVFLAGLYSRQACVQNRVMCITRSHTAHKFVHNTVHALHIFCAGCTAAAYIQGRLVCSTATPKRRLLFKTGLNSRVAFIQDLMVDSIKLICRFFCLRHPRIPLSPSDISSSICVFECAGK